MAKELSYSDYDEAEKRASSRFSIRVNQAFHPDMFSTVGYPSRINDEKQLWRYIDVMHEARTEYNINVLLSGLTEHEFQLFHKITKIVDEFSSKNFGKRAHATSALLRAIHVLRSIKSVTGERRPTILEVGPGCGYLGMLLIIEGYPYICTDVAQAFYLYQNRMLSLVAKEFVELANDERSIDLSIDMQPYTAVHIPWWKWVTFHPENIKFDVGLITCNHCFCEMHPGSLAYLAAVSKVLLNRGSAGGSIVFDEWGYDLLRSEQYVLKKFEEFGFRLCHNEDGISAFATEQASKGWQVYYNVIPRKAKLSKTERLKMKLKKLSNKMISRLSPSFRKTLNESQSQQRFKTEGRVPDFIGDNPLSQALRSGRSRESALAHYRLADVRAFLESYFGGSIPQNEDEKFFSLINSVY